VSFLMLPDTSLPVAMASYRNFQATPVGYERCWAGNREQCNRAGVGDLGLCPQHLKELRDA